MSRKINEKLTKIECPRTPTKIDKQSHVDEKETKSAEYSPRKSTKNRRVSNVYENRRKINETRMSTTTDEESATIESRREITDKIDENQISTETEIDNRSTSCRRMSAESHREPSVDRNRERSNVNEN